jgi:adenine-specific DNA-methyltransferase
MAKIDITKTELIWPGKYNEDGTRKEVPRVSLPFQVIETVNESRATREVRQLPQRTLFDVYEGKEGDTFEAGWRNKLIWGDNLLVIGSLLEKFAGKVDLIYIDPPFATGSDFGFTTEIGEEGLELGKEQSLIEEKAYRDTWGHGLESYLAMLYPRLRLLYDLLAPTGALYVHLGWQVSGFIRPILDEFSGQVGSLGARDLEMKLLGNAQRHIVIAAGTESITRHSTSIPRVLSTRGTLQRRTTSRTTSTHTIDTRTRTAADSSPETFQRMD